MWRLLFLLGAVASLDPLEWSRQAAVTILGQTGFGDVFQRHLAQTRKKIKMQRGMSVVMTRSMNMAMIKQKRLMKLENQMARRKKQLEQKKAQQQMTDERAGKGGGKGGSSKGFKSKAAKCSTSLSSKSPKGKGKSKNGSKSKGKGGSSKGKQVCERPECTRQNVQAVIDFAEACIATLSPSKQTKCEKCTSFTPTSFICSEIEVDACDKLTDCKACGTCLADVVAAVSCELFFTFKDCDMFDCGITL